MTSSIEVLDKNLQMMANVSFSHLLQIGIKYNIFKALSKKPNGGLESIEVQNTELLERFIETLNKLGIIENTSLGVMLKKLPQEYIAPDDYSFSDWMMSLERVYFMMDYAFIRRDHPYVSMDFDKDADFWDIRLNSKFASLYRSIIDKVAGISDGKSVIDIGCGSVSPVEIGKQAGPNGYYMGIDYSAGLLEIARERVKEGGYDWVNLKEIDAHLIRPSRKYDVAVMSFVLEYLKDRGRVIHRVLDSLESGGKLIIVEPFRDNFEKISALEFFEGLVGDFVGYPSTEEVKRAILDNGFNVDVKTLGKSVMVVTKH
ncbi:methyltransferase [Thermococcus sp. P6]|uniref:class I SAM-dependent methyltransferase n=1 Tax=Thermococcus sp. P6 TaxID=122420 RepID=UPI000B59A4D5|nr:class I SAM-dependent methyltransferase [Thermococcus sp. P6]ASJ11167.1 methyltransferase [Thermococcus sp. P6]